MAAQNTTSTPNNPKNTTHTQRYENRLRDLSTLEKVYDYFATNVDANGRKAMDVRDCVRAVAPTFPASGSAAERAGFLDGERGRRAGEGGAAASGKGGKGGAGGRGGAAALAAEPRDSAFRALDDDGDGLISFDEFRLVVLLLSIPAADVDVVFAVLDADGSGTVSAEEFDAALAEIGRRAGLGQRFHARPGQPHRHHGHGGGGGDGGGGADGGERTAAAPEAAAAAAAARSPGNLARALFGGNLKGALDLKRFRGFLDRLHADVTRLEFAHYDGNGGEGYGGGDTGEEGEGEWAVGGCASTRHHRNVPDRSPPACFIHSLPILLSPSARPL